MLPSYHQPLQKTLQHLPKLQKLPCQRTQPNVEQSHQKGEQPQFETQNLYGNHRHVGEQRPFGYLGGLLPEIAFRFADQSHNSEWKSVQV
jgi:hypothetical protein